MATLNFILKHSILMEKITVFHELHTKYTTNDVMLKALLCTLATENKMPFVANGKM